MKNWSVRSIVTDACLRRSSICTLLAVCAFGIAGAAVAQAQDVEALQQRASFAYREMQQAERNAEQATLEAREIDAQSTELQKQLEAVRKRAAAAQAREKDARARAAAARKHWEAAAEALDKARLAPKP